MKILRRTDETQHLRYGEDIGLQAAILTYVFTYQYNLQDHCRDDNCRRFLNVICKHLEGNDTTRKETYAAITNAVSVLRDYQGIIMDFDGIKPLINLFGEPFIWYNDDVHYNFVDNTIIFPSEKTKQIMRTQGIDYKEVQRGLYTEWRSRQYVYFPREVQKLSKIAGPYMTKDEGIYEGIPFYGHGQNESGPW